jgi:hypothetical protein
LSGHHPYKCNLFGDPVDDSDCDTGAMARMSGFNELRYSGDCLAPNGSMAVKVRTCNLSDFTEYLTGFDDRLGAVFDRVDRATALAREPINDHLRALLEGELRPIDELAGGLACNALAGPYRELVDSFCFQALYGFRQIAISYLVLGLLQLPLVIPTYMAWRAMKDCKDAAEDPAASSTSKTVRLEGLVSLDDIPMCPSCHNLGRDSRGRPCDCPLGRRLRLGPSAATDDEKLADVSFLPGFIGLRADWTKGIVKEVVNGGQGEKAGVQVGWKFLSVNGEPYSVDILDAKITGGDVYVITFYKRRPQEEKYRCCMSCWGVDEQDEEDDEDEDTIDEEADQDQDAFRI